jgi:hypothetical protein
MKLSKTKKELIGLMREGWECGRDGIYIRLQKEGLGMGGETRRCMCSQGTNAPSIPLTHLDS